MSPTFLLAVRARMLHLPGGDPRTPGRTGVVASVRRQAPTGRRRRPCWPYGQECCIFRGATPGPPAGRESLLAFAARHPQDVADILVGRTGKNEEQVRQAVQVGRRERIHVVSVDLQRCPRGALGAAYDRAGLVEQGRARGAARQDEGAELLQPLVEAVAVRLQLVDVELLD